MQPFGVAPVVAPPAYGVAPPLGFAPALPLEAQLAGPGLAPMELVVQGERKEAEYEWYRYSPFALPFLVLILGIAVILLWLTLSQGNVSYIHILPGNPRTLVREVDDDAEGGIPRGNRDVRIAAFIIAGVASLLILIVMYVRPASKARKGAYFGLAVLLIVAGILAWIAFGMDVSDENHLVECDDRDYGVLLPTANAHEANLCDNLSGLAVVAVVFDGLLGFFTIFTAVALVVAVIVAGKRAGPAAAAGSGEEYYESAYAGPVRAGLSRSTRLCLVLLVLANLVCVAVLIIFTIIISNLEPVYDMDIATGVARGTNLPEGWPVPLTRLRLSATGIIILTVLITFIPFRSRVAAYVLGFILFLATILLFISFSLDLKSLDTSNGMRCPAGFNCQHRRYIATIILDIILGFIILVYLLAEFVARLASESTHASKVFY